MSDDGSVIRSGNFIIHKMSNRAPIKSRWNKGDDAKLRKLIQDRIIDPSERHHSAIEKIHKHWPHKNFMTFARLVRAKLRDWETDQVLGGARGKFCAL